MDELVIINPAYGGAVGLLKAGRPPIETEPDNQRTTVRSVKCEFVSEKK